MDKAAGEMRVAGAVVMRIRSCGGRSSRSSLNSAAARSPKHQHLDRMRIPIVCWTTLSLFKSGWVGAAADPSLVRDPTCALRQYYCFNLEPRSESTHP
jgi:hypothetical protein